MTTTAPSKPKATKKKSALENLLALEEARDTAKEEASRIGSEYHAKFQQFRGLHDRRHQLAHREPRLIDHQGQPAEPGNAIAEIDEEIAALGDLNDLQARVEHARKVEDKAKEDVTAYAARSFYAIVAELKPEASKLKDELQAWNDSGVEIVERYIAFAGRIEGLKGGDRQLQRLRAAALDVAPDLKREIQNRTFPLPSELR